MQCVGVSDNSAPGGMASALCDSSLYLTADGILISAAVNEPLRQISAHHVQLRKGCSSHGAGAMAHDALCTTCTC